MTFHKSESCHLIHENFGIHWLVDKQTNTLFHTLYYFMKELYAFPDAPTRTKVFRRKLDPGEVL